MQLTPTEEQEYLGRVKRVDGHRVIAEIGPPDDMDSWEVVLQTGYFQEAPQPNQKIRCRVRRTATQAGTFVSSITVEIDKEPRKQLKDFGIDKEEWLRWASQIDV